MIGSFRIRNHDLFETRAEDRSDPRYIFYRAILESGCRYENYLAAVGSVTVEPRTYKSGPISGRAQLMYFRRKKWIADESE